MIKNHDLAFIGFGEAAQAFCEGWADNPPARVRAFDHKTADPLLRAAKAADYARWSVEGCEEAKGAVSNAAVVLSLVTADQAVIAARTTAAAIGQGAVYFDMNSVSPDAKRSAAEAIEGAGGVYVDVAVMSPVRPALLNTPLLVSGPYAQEGLAALQALGFRGRCIQGGVGVASAVKMIRSIMVKGLEALSAECALSADKAGVLEEVVASLEASDPALNWRERIDYNLDRMMIHGARRAAEMRESSATAHSLGQTGAMAAASAAWQDRIAELGLAPPPFGLTAKLDSIRAAQEGRDNDQTSRTPLS